MLNIGYTSTSSYGGPQKIQFLFQNYALRWSDQKLGYSTIDRLCDVIVFLSNPFFDLVLKGKRTGSLVEERIDFM